MFYFYRLLIVYICMSVCGYMHVSAGPCKARDVSPAGAGVTGRGQWKTCGIWPHSPHHEGLGDGTRVLRFGGECLCALSHLSGLEVYFYEANASYVIILNCELYSSSCLVSAQEKIRNSVLSLLA